MRLLLLWPCDLLPRHAIWKSAVRHAEKELLPLLSSTRKNVDLDMALQLTLLVGDVYVGHVPEEEDCTMFPFDDEDEYVMCWGSVPSAFLQYELRIHRLGMNIDALHEVHALRTRYLDRIDLDRELTSRRYSGLHDLVRGDRASEYCLRGMVFDMADNAPKLLDKILRLLVAGTSLMEKNLSWESTSTVDQEFCSLIDLIGTVSLDLDDTVYDEAVDYFLRTANLYLVGWPSVFGGEWDGYNGCDVVAMFCDLFKQFFLVLNAMNRQPCLFAVERVRSTSTDRNDSIGFSMTMAGRRIDDCEIGRSMGFNFFRADDKFEFSSSWSFAGSRLVGVAVNFLLGNREWVVDEGEELFFRAHSLCFGDEEDEEGAWPHWHDPFHFRFDDENISPS